VSVLAAIEAEKAVSITSLAEFLEMERSTLTRNLRPLEARGFVEVAPEGRYRRRVLALTPAGRAAFLEVVPRWEKGQTALRARLGDRDWDSIQQAVGRLAEKAFDRK
jgi:DNA-binding MarR family transcriptional regulator